MLKSTASSVESVGIVIAAIVGVIVMVIGASLLLAWPVMLLWNWLMPAIFGLCKITFWQALGIMVLSSFLTKGSSYNSNSK